MLQHVSVETLRHGARLTWAIALLLWVAALVLLALVYQEVTYVVCDGPLLHLPPPTVHWPPQGKNVQLIDLQHQFTIWAAGISMIGAFLALYTEPAMGVIQRTRLLVGSVFGALILAAFLWLLVEQHVIHAHVDALARCL